MFGEQKETTKTIPGVGVVFLFYVFLDSIIIANNKKNPEYFR